MNDTTKWIMIALLLLLIAAAVIVLLRSPGKDRDGGDDTVERADDRDGVPAGRGEHLEDAPQRGVYDQEADHREGGAHAVGRDEPVAAAEPSTYDRPVVDEAPSQEPPAAAVADHEPPVDSGVTYAEDIGATTGPQAAADRDATGDDAAPYQPAAGAFEDAEPGTRAEEGYRPGEGGTAAEPPTPLEQHPTEELTAGDTEGYGGPAPVADTTPSTAPASTSTGVDQEHPHGETTSAAGVATEGPAPDRPFAGGPADAGSEPLTADEVLAASDAGRDTPDRPAGAPTTGAPAAGATEAGAAARGAGDSTVDGPTDAAAQPVPPTPSPGPDERHDHDDTAGSPPVFAESVYGPGSADPLDDGSGPAGWAVKGNVGSMLFHTSDSPSYDAVRAEVWFESEEAARSAGFAHWDRRRR